MTNFKRLIIGTALLVTVVSYGSGSDPSGVLISETYTVRTGDTLWTISEQYIQKNTYGPRDIREFYHGIIEINQDVLASREPGEIHPGDKLTVNYWAKE
ncbi:LysM peptidoglycan-binding domain-containing protein [Sporomusa malonica]|uniref:LysM domain-containing protein n=1 Tax=Sporomusa malonica TaxID=112901 RepID=A0A1W2A836_9FIRM|nr:LysM peptidoglycan-binding domain-containing protein [Sporomusa malonica]SMC56817.1 LysM domain-containing protein [Sporomusa malonica]